MLKWGDAFINATAEYIKENCPGIKGFNRRGLYRMRQFYETYKGNEFVSPLLTQISWTNKSLFKSLSDVVDRLCVSLNSLSSDSLKSISGRTWVLDMF